MGPEHQTAAVQEPAAAPPAVAAPVRLTAVAQVLALQRTAGNHAVTRLLAREDKDPGPVEGITVSPLKATVPLEAGASIKAAAKPDTSTDVKYSLEAGSIQAATGTSIDATGAVTVAADQAGGTLKAKATASDGNSWADQAFRLAEKPAAISSTSSSVAGNYEAHFTHTFSSAGPSSAGLEGANINEKFDALTAKTPFGGDFTLQANRAGSSGWDLDSSGAMVAVDKVSISTAGIDATKFVANASNPTPAAALPQGFKMTQKFHAKTFPSGNYEDAPFTTTDHSRTLEEVDGKLVVTIGAGQGSESIDYVGTPVFRNMKADKTTVEASEPKPKQGAWTQNEVQVSVDVEPSTATAAFSIAGEKLGCSVDKKGKVLIGDKPGTIEVRAGTTKHYDAVKITITARPAPAATPTPGAGGTSTGLDAGDEDS